MVHVECITANRCLSIHPGAGPKWLFSAPRIRECLICKLFVIADETNIFSVRVAAVGRLRSVFEQQQSIDALCHEPPHVFVPMLLQILSALAEAGPDAGIADHFIDIIILAVFACDERVGHYNFTEFLLVSIVDSFSATHVTNVKTILFCLLARCLHSAPLREAGNISAFRLSCKYAISGRFQLVVDKSIELLSETDEAWEQLDLICAVANVMCALLSMELISDSRTILSFGGKVSLVLRDVAENPSKRQNILHLVREILLRGDRDGNVFHTVNGDGALVHVLKCALTSGEDESIIIAKEVISILCKMSPKIGKILIEENLPEFCVESLRRLHRSQCSDSRRCKITVTVMKTLNTVVTSNPCANQQVGCRYMFDVVLNIASTCVLHEAENVAITVLQHLVGQVRTSELSELKTAKALLEFIHGVGMRYIHSKEKGDIQEVVELLLKFLERANLNFPCIALLTDIIYLFVEGLGFTSIVTCSILRMLGQLDGLTGKDEHINEVRIRIVELLFTRAGSFVANHLVEAFSDCNIARTLVDILEVIQLGLSINALFVGHNSKARQNIVESCWYYISPIDFITIGRFLNEKNDAHRKMVIKKYISQLMNLEDNELKNIPVSLCDFDTMLRCTNTPFSSNLSMRILQQSISTGNSRLNEWVDTAVDGLQERICNVQVFEEDEIQCLYLLFRICSVFDQRVPSVDIPAALLLQAVRSVHFNISVEPALLAFLTTPESDIDVRWVVLEKLTELKQSASDEDAYLFVRNAEKYLQEQLASLVDVLVSREVSEGLMELILSVFRNAPRNSTSDAIALIDIDIVVDALRMFKSATSGKWNSSVWSDYVSVPWKEHQISGILLLITDMLNDFDDRLITISLECLVGISTEVVMENSTIVLGIIRYLVRVLETTGCIGSPKWPFEIAPQICNLLRGLSVGERSMMSDNELFIIGACACLLVFLLQADVRVLQFLEPISNEEWANLVSVLAPESSISHSWICAAINCTVLLDDVNSRSTQTHESRVLLGALVASAFSGNLMLKDAALSCLTTVSLRCTLPGIRRVMHLERSLCRNIATKIVRQENCLLGSEVVYFGSCIGSPRFDAVMAITSEQFLNELKEVVAELQPTFTIEKNNYGVQESDIKFLSMRVKQLVVKSQGMEKMVSRNRCRQKRVNYGYRAVVISWGGSTAVMNTSEAH